jgi:hypothetical protein
VGRSTTGPAGRFLFALVPPLYRLAAFHRGGLLGRCSHGQQIYRQCCTCENTGGLLGQQPKKYTNRPTFFIEHPKVNQQFTKVCTTNSCYYAGYIFRDSFNQRTNNINNYFPHRLYRQDPATMLGGLFAFAKSVLVHKKKTLAIGPKIEKKLLQDCPRRDHTTVQRV